MTPTPSSHPDTADAPLSLPADWSDVLEHQHRWWTEWVEAGQLWTSWWFLQWPAFGWPPIGVVLPPQGAGANMPMAKAAPVLNSKGQPAHTRSMRASGQRHR